MSQVMGLAGHSGARLSLIEWDGRLLVRKMSGSSGQNARLQAQCAKLRAMRDLGCPCPAVLYENSADGIFSFDMEFVSGETLAHAILSGQALHWPTLLSPLRAFIDRLRATSGPPIAPELFTNNAARQSA